MFISFKHNLLVILLSFFYNPEIQGLLSRNRSSLFVRIIETQSLLFLFSNLVSDPFCNLMFSWLKTDE